MVSPFLPRPSGTFSSSSSAEILYPKTRNPCVTGFENDALHHSVRILQHDSETRQQHSPETIRNQLPKPKVTLISHVYPTHGIEYVYITWPSIDGASPVTTAKLKLHTASLRIAVM
jgi:hypothetical protein